MNNNDLTEGNKNEIISQFVSTIEGADAETAKRYLEIANWDIEMALETYFDQIENKTEQVHQDLKSLEPSSSRNENNQKSNKNSSRFKTFDDLKGEDLPEEGGQDLFAGGEKSGTAIRYPNMPENVNSLLNGLFSKINQPVSDEEEEEGENSQKKPSNIFTGTGFKISDEAASSSNPDLSLPGSFPQQPSTPQRNNELVVKKLTLWRNGLALEDGPLISYTSPEGQEFLRGVNEGRAPISLLGVQPGQRVDLHVQRNMDEDYKGPSVSAKPFQGSGNRLGSIVPSAKPYNIIENESQIQDASHTYEINPNLPQTSIQIRLSDGRRLVAKFNHSHTLSDLYNYVQASINSTQPFTLQTTFPTKKLEKSDITLSEANLLNSAVVQRPL